MTSTFKEFIAELHRLAHVAKDEENTAWAENRNADVAIFAGKRIAYAHAIELAMEVEHWQ